MSEAFVSSEFLEDTKSWLCSPVITITYRHTRPKEHSLPYSCRCSLSETFRLRKGWGASQPLFCVYFHETICDFDPKKKFNDSFQLRIDNLSCNYGWLLRFNTFIKNAQAGRWIKKLKGLKRSCNLSRTIYLKEIAIRKVKELLT